MEKKNENRPAQGDENETKQSQQSSTENNSEDLNEQPSIH